MAKILEITQLGNPVLRKQAKEVENLLDKNVQELISDMFFTLNAVNGAGIAAPQVNELLRVFIVSSRPTPRYPNAPQMEAFTVINPTIVSYSEEIVSDWEGCLSIPKVRGLVPRSKSIIANYFDLKGKKQKIELTDFPARVFQHEYDHLNGIVFFDRMDDVKDIMMESEWTKRVLGRDRD